MMNKYLDDIIIMISYALVIAFFSVIAHFTVASTVELGIYAVLFLLFRKELKE